MATGNTGKREAAGAHGQSGGTDAPAQGALDTQGQDDARWARLGTFGRGLAGIVISLLIWEVLCRLLAVPEYLLPRPSVIFERLYSDWALLLTHTLTTMWETVAGFVIAVVVGAACAILVTSTNRVRDSLMPLLVVTQLIPKIAIAPVILVWFGYGLSSKIVMAFLIAVFPIIIDMAAGLAMIQHELIELLRSLGASRWQIFVKAQIPNSLPHLFSGMKVAITLAMIGAVVGEFVGGSKGLGYIIVVGTSDLKTALVFAAIFVLTAAGFLVYALIEWLERIVIPWSAAERDDLMKLAEAR